MTWPASSGGRWWPNPLRTRPPRSAYERGWNAINELVRSDNTWHGYARNVMFVNNHDGTFTEASGALALDFLEDSRSFALADIDHDGRLEVILKNRNAPQLRILHNAMKDIGQSISFRLRGHKSNRDAIGAAITVEAGGTRQTKYLQAGSGFLAQHSKELFFRRGQHEGGIRATVRWPSGLTQSFRAVARQPPHRDRGRCFDIRGAAVCTRTARSWAARACIRNRRRVARRRRDLADRTAASAGFLAARSGRKAT